MPRHASTNPPTRTHATLHADPHAAASAQVPGQAGARTVLLAAGSLLVVPAALALLAPHVLEAIVAVALHGTHPELAWGTLAMLAGLPLTLAGLPWTGRAHAEITSTLTALGHALDDLWTLHPADASDSPVHAHKDAGAPSRAWGDESSARQRAA